MSYNLTSKQREGLKWVVNLIREGQLDETFSVNWTMGGHIFHRGVPWKGSVDNEAYLEHGTIDAWDKANMIIAKEISENWGSTVSHMSRYTRCTITQLAYNAVDSNFIEPEGQPNFTRLQSFLANNAFFNFEDLRTLATIIGEDHESISGSTKQAYARELVLKAKRSDTLWDLVRAAFTIE